MGTLVPISMNLNITPTALQYHQRPLRLLWQWFLSLALLRASLQKINLSTIIWELFMGYLNVNPGFYVEPT